MDPDLHRAREIRVHDALVAILDSSELAAVGREKVEQMRHGDDIAAAWAKGEDWVRHARLRRPYRSRWRLVQGLAGGLAVPEDRVASLLAELDPATLDALRPWVEADPGHRALAERHVPSSVAKPAWWRP